MANAVYFLTLPWAFILAYVLDAAFALTGSKPLLLVLLLCFGPGALVLVGPARSLVGYNTPVFATIVLFNLINGIAAIAFFAARRIGLA